MKRHRKINEPGALAPPAPKPYAVELCGRNGWQLFSRYATRDDAALCVSRLAKGGMPARVVVEGAPDGD